MSLILDALRKADAERERGALPNLHSQPVNASVEASRSAKASPNWLWAAIGIAFGLGAAALWVMMVGRNTPAPSAATAHSTPAAPQSPSVAAPPPMAGTIPWSPAVTDARSVAEPAPWPQPSDRKAPVAAKGDAKSEAPVRTLGNVPLATTIYSREQLPPDVRAALPQLAIGGSMYSAVPTARSLIINGQLYREKDRLTQELSLEEIKLKSAIFNFRGYRVEVMF